MSLYIFQTVQRGSAWDDEGRSPSVEGRGWRHKNGGRERTRNRGGTQTFRLYEFSCLCPFFLLFTFPSPFLLLVVRVSKANRISLQNLLSGWKHNCGTLRLTAASLYSINPKPRLFSLADCSNEPYVEPKGCEIEVNLKLNKERK